jgi:hypothetical protein
MGDWQKVLANVWSRQIIAKNDPKRSTLVVGQKPYGKSVNKFSKNMNSSLSSRITISLICLGLTALFTGCKTIDSTAASKFATSVTTVKSQADDALNAAATLTRDAGITYVATQPTLKESDFAETPTADIISEWDNTLSTIEAYALNLAALSSPDATKNFNVAATNLFNQFTQTADRLNTNPLSSSPAISAGLATGFTQVANLILEAKAQATARKIAAATDPQIMKILNLLAAEIGENHDGPCLRNTIYRVWDTKAGALTKTFLKAPDQAAKIVVVQQYANLLAERTAQDESLLALRRSLLALSDAHHALAQGNETSIQSTLTIVLNDLQQTHDLYNQFSSDLKK